MNIDNSRFEALSSVPEFFAEFSNTRLNAVADAVMALRSAAEQMGVSVVEFDRTPIYDSYVNPVPNSSFNTNSDVNTHSHVNPAPNSYVNPATNSYVNTAPKTEASNATVVYQNINTAPLADPEVVLRENIAAAHNKQIELEAKTQVADQQATIHSLAEHRARVNQAHDGQANGINQSHDGLRIDNLHDQTNGIKYVKKAA